MRTLPDKARVKISHYRKTPKGELLPSYFIKQIGLEVQPQGGMTLATIEYEGLIYIGAAECNEKDNFSKTIGRNIAQGRALKKLYNSVLVNLKEQ